MSYGNGYTQKNKIMNQIKWNINGIDRYHYVYSIIRSYFQQFLKSITIEIITKSTNYICKHQRKISTAFDIYI
jgi:hypothetical protein